MRLPLRTEKIVMGKAAGRIGLPLTGENLQARLLIRVNQQLGSKLADETKRYKSLLKELEEERRRSAVLEQRIEGFKQRLLNLNKPVKSDPEWTKEDSEIEKDNPGWRYYRPYRDIYKEVRRKYPGFFKAMHEAYKAEKDKNTVRTGCAKVYDEMEQMSYLSEKYSFVKKPELQVAETQTQTSKHSEDEPKPTTSPSTSSDDVGTSTTRSPAENFETPGPRPKTMDSEAQTETPEPKLRSHASTQTLILETGSEQTSKGSPSKTSINRETQTTAVDFHLSGMLVQLKEVPVIAEKTPVSHSSSGNYHPGPSSEDQGAIKKKLTPRNDHASPYRRPRKVHWKVPPPPGCWNCRDLSHRYPACTLPFDHIFCFHCGFDGYKSNDCKNCDGKDLVEGVDYFRKTPRK